VSCRCSNGNEGEVYIGEEPESIFIALYFFLFYSLLFPSVFQKGDLFGANWKELNVPVNNIIAWYLNRIEEK
jgi:hypothetical protein